MRLGSRAVSPVSVDYAIALIASCGFGQAVAVAWGTLAPGAFFPLLVAAALVVWRLLVLAGQGGQPDAKMLDGELLWVPILIMLVALCWAGHEDRQLWNAPGPSSTARWAQLAMGAVLVSYLPSALGVPEPRLLPPVRLGVMALLVGVLGVEVVLTTPNPQIDVWRLQHDALALLKAGSNPYRLAPPYHDGLVLPYPPTVLYTGFLSELVAGDIRFVNVVYVVLTGVAFAAIARRSGRRLPAIGYDAPALLLWLQPRLLFVIEQAWVDVMSLALLSGGLAFYLYGRRWVAAALLGVALATKQTMFWFLPLLFLLLDLRRREWMVLLGTMALLLGPFVLWDARALWAANFTLHDQLPPRHDSLGFMAWHFARYGQWRSTTWLSFALGLGVLGLCAARLRRSLPAFAWASTATYFLFFFFQKQAFANYYYFVGGLATLAAAIALHAGPADRSTARSTEGSQPC